LDISVDLSKSFVSFDAFIWWRINDQSAVVVVALIKIPANDPFEDGLELVIID
jgi:hypothetical protein